MGRKVKFHLFDINPTNTEYETPDGAQLIGLVPMGTNGVGDLAVRAIFIEEVGNEEDAEMRDLRKQLEDEYRKMERLNIEQQLQAIRNAGERGDEPEVFEFNQETGEFEAVTPNPTFGPNSVGEGGSAAETEHGRPQVPGPGEDLTTAERTRVDNMDLSFDTDGDGDRDVDAAVDPNARVETVETNDGTTQATDRSTGKNRSRNKPENQD